MNNELRVPVDTSSEHGVRVVEVFAPRADDPSKWIKVRELTDAGELSQRAAALDSELRRARHELAQARAALAQATRARDDAERAELRAEHRAQEAEDAARRATSPDGDALGDELRSLRAEVARIRRGELTREELTAICEKLPEDLELGALTP